MWSVQRRCNVCDERNCFQKAEMICCLCEDDVCSEHSHIVDENNGFTRYVCDTCYATCMLAYEREQQETVK